MPYLTRGLQYLERQKVPQYLKAGPLSGDPVALDQSRADKAAALRTAKGEAMNKHIKRLQDMLAKGKINAQEYQEMLKDLLDDKVIEQADFDQHKDFEPQSDDDKPIYSQADFDRSIMVKARQMVKKALKDAGVEVDGIENKELLTTFATLAVQGQQKGKLDATEEEITQLRKKAKSLDDLQPTVKSLSLENAILKAAGTLQPHNPKQVVRALDDYKELLEYDENDVLVAKSVDRALKKLSEAEPNLFKAVGEGEGGEEGGQNNNQQGFQGKPPGGSAGNNQGGDKDKKHEATKNRALELMGLSKQK